MLHDEDRRCLLVLPHGHRAYAVAIYDSIQLAKEARAAMPRGEDYFLLPVNRDSLTLGSMKLLQEGVALKLADWERGRDRRVVFGPPERDYPPPRKLRRRFLNRIGLIRA